MGRTTFSGPVKSNNGFEGDLTGTITGAVNGHVTGWLNGYQLASRSIQTASGQVSTNTDTTQLSTSAADITVTLNGALPNGFIKRIVLVHKGAGKATFTSDQAMGFTSVEFTAVGNALTVENLLGGWFIIGNYGCTVNT